MKNSDKFWIAVLGIATIILTILFTKAMLVTMLIILIVLFIVSAVFDGDNDKYNDKYDKDDYNIYWAINWVYWTYRGTRYVRQKVIQFNKWLDSL